MENNKTLKFDAHVHSSGVSRCSRVTYRQIVDQKLAQGYDGAVLTNHCQWFYYEPSEHAAFMKRFVEEFKSAEAYAREKNFRLILGLEVTLHDPSYNDWLLYGATEAFLLNTPCLYELSQKQAFELCRDNGIVFVQAHPFRNSGWGDERYMHGVEINCTGGDLERADEVVERAKQRGLLVTCGTDYHGPDRTFRGGTFLPAWVETSVELAEYLRGASATELFLEDRTLSVPVPKGFFQK